VIDDRQHVGAQYLDGDFVATVVGMEFREMDLRNRGRRDRGRIEFGENLAGRATISFFDFS
jgi:hypothetical protein